MGIWSKLAGTIGENLSKDKEQREQEKAYVRNNEGSKAICAYIAYLFEKGNAGYDWVKKNRVGLYPEINYDSVSLCYMKVGYDDKNLSSVLPKDAEVVKYSFQEMYNWYGLDANCGYSFLNSKTERYELENMISSEVQKLPHIKYNNGFLVRAFQ